MDVLPPFLPHDLLWISDARALVFSEPAPDWASPAWLTQAPVVVRREQTIDADLLPVGARGLLRSQRLAGYLPVAHVVRRLTPETVVEVAVESGALDAPTMPCLRSLSLLRARLDATGLRWGVTGSLGFTIASGLTVIRESSDLDLVLRAPRSFTRDDARTLAALFADAPSRVDAQIDTGHGGFALLEWAAGNDRVLLKTARGPALVEDPWRTDLVDAALGAFRHGMDTRS